MKINKFAFNDKSSNWELSDITFDRLTLLVGASGVGKTQILKAILSLQQISNGESVSGIQWTVNFDTISGQKYIWQGEFEDGGIQNFLDDDDDETKKTSQIY